MYASHIHTYYMCILHNTLYNMWTESLFCTAEINIMHQLYFNKIKKLKKSQDRAQSLKLRQWSFPKIQNTLGKMCGRFLIKYFPVLASNSQSMVITLCVISVCVNGIFFFSSIFNFKLSLLVSGSQIALLEGNQKFWKGLNLIQT